MSSIINYQQVVGSRILEKRGHADTDFYARVGNVGYVPSFGAVIIPFVEDLLEQAQVFLDGDVLLPPQQQDGNLGVGRLLGLSVNEHGGILQMSRKGLELVSLRRRRDSRHHLLDLVMLYWGNLSLSAGRVLFFLTKPPGTGIHTGSWAKTGAGAGWTSTLGASRRFLAAGGSIGGVGESGQRPGRGFERIGGLERSGRLKSLCNDGLRAFTGKESLVSARLRPDELGGEG